MRASRGSSRNQLRAVIAVIVITLGLTLAALFWARSKVRALQGSGGGTTTAPSPPPRAGATP